METDSGWRGGYRPLLPPFPPKMMWLFCEIGTLTRLGPLERHFKVKSHCTTKSGGNGQAGRRGGERQHFRDLGAEGASL